MLIKTKFAAQTAVLRSFDYIGVQMRWGKPLDVRGKTDDPIAATYLADGRPFVFEVPLDRCRGLEGIGFDLGPQTIHPFVRTLEAYANGSSTKFEDSPLGRYYDYFQPQSAAQALGLDHRSALIDFPPLALVLPWDAKTPQERQEQRRLYIESENREFGLNATAEEGWKSFGPVSQRKGAGEMKRLQRVHDSIRDHGYHRHERRDGDISGLILHNDHEWAVIVKGSGQHRIAALAALGYRSAPIRIRPDRMTSFIRRKEVDCWPHVRSGLFEREEALVVFDRILKGRPPQDAVPPEWRKDAVVL